MFDSNDYKTGATRARLERQAEEREARDADEKRNEAREERTAAFHAGLCSYGAALSGGMRYEAEIADSALELAEAGVKPCPVGAALTGWLDAVTGAYNDRRAA